MMQFEKNGLKWARITNNLWGTMVAPKDYIFIEVTPFNGKYTVKYRNIEIKKYSKDELRLMRSLYNISYQADYSLAFVLGQHYNHYEWVEECEDYNALSKLIEEQTDFDVYFLGDVDAAGIPDVNDNVFGKVIIKKSKIETKIAKTFINYNKEEYKTVFTVQSDCALDAETIEAIKNIRLPIYWNDSQSKHYSFDTKLSSGVWLENIFYNNELSLAEAVIHNNDAHEYQR